MISIEGVSRKFQLRGKSARLGRLLAVSSAVLALCLPTFAQLNYGRIFGGVTDQSGGTIVGATVTVLDVTRGVSRPLQTDAAGEFSAPSLIPGTYTVRAEFKGFKTIERSDIVVGVGQDVRVDLTMEPGEQTQTVTVTGEPPQVNTTNAQLGGTIENQAVADLPVSGRTFMGLLTYKPGVVARPGVTANAYQSNGGRAQHTVWLLDGLYDVNAYHSATGNMGGQGGPSVELSNFLPIDAIQEVNIIENPKAEYGWKPGAQVNVGLKSGTNSIHGTAIAVGNDASMDAKNPFLSAAQPKAVTIMEQFGASVGGPIRKDKLFYFGSYEGQRYTIGSPRVVTEPTTALLTGNGAAGNSFPAAIADIIAKGHGSLLNSMSLAMAGCNAAGACDAANGLFGNAGTSASRPFSPNALGRSDNAIGKIDYHINEHNSVNGEIYIGDGSFVSPSVAPAPAPIQPYWSVIATNRTEVVRGVWDWIPNSNWVNEARFGLDHVSSPLISGDCTTSQLGAPNFQQAFGYVSGAPQCGFPQLTIFGFSVLGGIRNPQPIVFDTYAGSDSVSYTRGKHLIKFGGEFHETFLNGGQFTFGKGGINFGTNGINSFAGATPLEDFLTGKPSTGSLLLGNPVVNLLYQQYAGFVQDDWRISQRITLNLGLRYEYVPPVTEQNNLWANFDPNSATGLVQATHNHPQVYNGDKNNFEPRLGLAWDVNGKGTTVIHAGGGLSYAVYPLLLLIGSTQGATLNTIPTGFKLVNQTGAVVPSPGTLANGTLALSNATTTLLPWTSGQPVFNSGAGSLTCSGLSTAPRPCNINVIDQNFKLTHVTTWTFGVQHAFTPSLSLSVSYVGNHGNESGILDRNAPVPGSNNTTQELQRRPYYTKFPYLGTIQFLTLNEHSNYNGLQATLTQRTSHGLSFTLGYTYAHALDMGSDEITEQLMMNATDPQLEYGNAGFDIRHVVTLGGSYLIPGHKSPGQLLEGWQLNSAIILMSPLPVMAVDTQDDTSGTGDLQDRWTLVGKPSDFNVGQLARVPCYGAAGSKFFAAGCSSAVPQACMTAAAAEPSGPGGTTGTQQLASIGCYMEGGSVIVPPAQGTFGSMQRNELRGQSFENIDFSVFKNWKFRERLTAQFRAEFFNLFNTVQYVPQGQGTTTTTTLSAPATFGVASSVAGATGGTVTGTGLPRRIQLGVKLIF